MTRSLLKSLVAASLLTGVVGALSLADESATSQQTTQSAVAAEAVQRFQAHLQAMQSGSDAARFIDDYLFLPDMSQARKEQHIRTAMNASKPEVMTHEVIESNAINKNAALVVRMTSQQDPKFTIYAPVYLCGNRFLSDSPFQFNARALGEGAAGEANEQDLSKLAVWALTRCSELREADAKKQ